MSSKNLTEFPGGSRVFADTTFDHGLAAAFFFAFSRAEYALKAAGWVKTGRSGEAKPNWDAFRVHVDDRFFRETGTGALASALAYLEGHPPDQQVWEGGMLSWRQRTARSGDTKSKVLIDHVKTIRNNLFHGGKELRNHALAERDSALLVAGLAVLSHIISLDPAVATAFSDTGPDRPVA